MRIAFFALIGAFVALPAHTATTDLPQAVPALDGPNLLILSLVLSAFAIRHLKSRK